MSATYKMSSKLTLSLIVVVGLVLLVGQFKPAESKLLRSSRYYDDVDSGYASPYGGSPYGGGQTVRTGEQALVTIRGARDTYSGMPPRHLALDSSPYPGSYPRGVYDRLDGYGGGRRPMGLGSDLVPVGPYNDRNRFDRYRMNSYDRPSLYEDAPARIGVTGVYPLGYRGRY